MSTSSAARVVIAGQGAIGSVIAYRCEQHGMDYRLIPRQLAHLRFTSLSGDTAPLPAPELNPICLKHDDIVILPLKAYQVVPFVKEHSVHIGQQTLVLLHNGMGTAAAIQTLCPQASIVQGITRLAAFKHQNTVTQTADGATDLSWLTTPNADTQASVTRVLDEILTPVIWHPSLQAAQWRKLIVNAVINPLTAVHRVKNGALAQAPFETDIRALIKEATVIAREEGVHLPDMLEEVMAVIEATANNYSSMYQDVQAGRPTEIDFINGYLCQRADQYLLAAPHHHSMVERVQALSASV